jgi:hypothetical protein
MVPGTKVAPFPEYMWGVVFHCLRIVSSLSCAYLLLLICRGGSVWCYLYLSVLTCTCCCLLMCGGGYCAFVTPSGLTLL